MSINKEYEKLEKGVKQLLGKEGYPLGKRIEVCKHASDGHIYDRAPYYTTLFCALCNQHYDVDNNGTEIQV